MPQHVARARTKTVFRIATAQRSHTTIARIRILLDRALDGRMDAVQELMESDPVNSIRERVESPGQLKELYLLASDASDYWAPQARTAKTRYTPIIAAYAHYLKWMAWTLHPIEEDDL